MVKHLSRKIDSRKTQNKCTTNLKSWYQKSEIVYSIENNGGPLYRTWNIIEAWNCKKIALNEIKIEFRCQLKTYEEVIHTGTCLQLFTNGDI